MFFSYLAIFILGMIIGLVFFSYAYQNYLLQYDASVSETDGNKNQIQTQNIADGYGIQKDGTIRNRESTLKELEEGSYKKIAAGKGTGYYNFSRRTDMASSSLFGRR